MHAGFFRSSPHHPPLWTDHDPPLKVREELVVGVVAAAIPTTLCWLEAQSMSTNSRPSGRGFALDSMAVLRLIIIRVLPGCRSPHPTPPAAADGNLSSNAPYPKRTNVNSVLSSPVFATCTYAAVVPLTPVRRVVCVRCVSMHSRENFRSFRTRSSFLDVLLGDGRERTEKRENPVPEADQPKELHTVPSDVSFFLLSVCIARQN